MRSFLSFNKTIGYCVRKMVYTTSPKFSIASVIDLIGRLCYWTHTTTCNHVSAREYRQIVHIDMKSRDGSIKFIICMATSFLC